MNVHEAAVKIVGHYDRESYSPRQHHTADLKRAESVIARAIADATAEQTRRAEWYALLARAANTPTRAFWMAVLEDKTVVSLEEGAQQFTCDTDANGLPVESPELRHALEAALKE